MTRRSLLAIPFAALRVRAAAVATPITVVESKLGDSTLLAVHGTITMEQFDRLARVCFREAHRRGIDLQMTAPRLEAGFLE